MKRILSFFFFLLMLTSCEFSLTEITSTERDSIKFETNRMLNDWHKAASDANFENYFGFMDSLSFFIGTDASENWTKKQFKAFSKPFFDKGKAWDFKTLERNIYVNSSGEVVWFDELLNTWMGTCRGSGVLEKKKNVWTIKQYVLSVTIPNDDISKVIAVKKKNDSIFLKTNYHD